MKAVIHVLNSSAIIVLLLIAGISLAADGGTVRLSQSKTVKSGMTDSAASAECVQQALSPARPAASEARSGEGIHWQVISSGGTGGRTVNHTLCGTIGQSIIGVGSSANYGTSHGFWQEFEGGLPFTCGDPDASGTIDIDDVVYLINYIFSGGPEPVPYESGDADCSGAADIDDVVWLIAYIFSGGNGPCDTDGDGVPDC